MQISGISNGRLLIEVHSDQYYLVWYLVAHVGSFSAAQLRRSDNRLEGHLRTELLSLEVGLVRPK